MAAPRLNSPRSELMGVHAPLPENVSAFVRYLPCHFAAVWHQGGSGTENYLNCVDRLRKRGYRIMPYTAPFPARIQTLVSETPMTTPQKDAA